MIRVFQPTSLVFANYLSLEDCSPGRRAHTVPNRMPLRLDKLCQIVERTRILRLSQPEDRLLPNSRILVRASHLNQLARRLIPRQPRDCEDRRLKYLSIRIVHRSVEQISAPTRLPPMFTIQNRVCRRTRGDTSVFAIWINSSTASGSWR
jgi:hypothetical protein